MMRRSDCVAELDGVLHKQFQLPRDEIVVREWRGSGGYVCRAVLPSTLALLLQMNEVYLSDPRSQETSNKIFPPLKLRLNDNQPKISFRIHISRHLLDPLYLSLDALIDAFNEIVGGPSVDSRLVMSLREMLRVAFSL